MKDSIVGNHRVRVYDNGGKKNRKPVADRYTVAYVGEEGKAEDGTYLCVSMDNRPSHPQGVCMTGRCHLGAHLGRRLSFGLLPLDCQTVVKSQILILDGFKQ